MAYYQERPHHNILDVFAEERAAEHGFVRVSAPMVRYSKLEFRQLLRRNGVRLCFTPMIIADSFNSSQKARDNEFTTSWDDQPVIAQFAAQDAAEFVKAAQLIYPYVDGIDLNVGCPQTWAIKKGYGCGLLRQPEVVRDIMQTVRRTLPHDFSVSLKIRLLSGESVRTTVELARQMEQCGVTFLTLHGRTMWQKTSDPLNVPAMAEVKQSLQSMPLIVNGNVRSWADAVRLHDETSADGVMAARGLLSNPSLFNPAHRHCDKTPDDCVEQWLDIATRAGDNINFQCFHHHLTFMWSNHLRRKQRLTFNNLTQKSEVFQFFDEQYGLRPATAVASQPFAYTKCTYTHVGLPSALTDEFALQSQSSWDPDSVGKFFQEFQGADATANETTNEDDDFDLEDSFFNELH